MMKFIRSHTQSKAAKVILWVLLFGLSGLTFLASFFGAKNQKPWVAKVNKQEISFMDLTNAAEPLKQQIQQIKQIFGDQASQFLPMFGITPGKSVYDVALDRLISTKANLSAAENAGINISDKYISEKMKDVKFIEKNLSDVIPHALIKDGHLDVNYLNTYLKMTNTPAEKFDESIKNSLELKAYNDLIKLGGYATKNNILEEFIKKFSNKKYEILTIDNAQFVQKAKEDQTIVSESNIDKYYNDNKEKYRVDEKRSGKLWEFSLESKTENGSKDKAEDKSKSSEVKNQSKSKFEAEAKKSILDSKKLKDFIEKNKGKSSDITNVTKKDYSTKTSKLFGLKKINDKAYYVEGNKGYIIELTKIDESYIPEKNSVLSKIKQDIIKNSASELLDNKLKELETESKKSNFDALSKKYNATYKKTDWVNTEKLNYGDSKDLDIPKKDVHVAADMSNVSDIITAQDDKKGYLIKLLEIEEVNQDKLNEQRLSLYNDISSKDEYENIKRIQDYLRDNSDVVLNQEIMSQINKYGNN